MATGVTGYQMQFQVMFSKRGSECGCVCVLDCVVWSDSRDGEWSVRGHLPRGIGSLQ